MTIHERLVEAGLRDDFDAAVNLKNSLQMMVILQQVNLDAAQAAVVINNVLIHRRHEANRKLFCWFYFALMLLFVYGILVPHVNPQPSVFTHDTFLESPVVTLVLIATLVWSWAVSLLILVRLGNQLLTLKRPSPLDVIALLFASAWLILWCYTLLQSFNART